MSDRYQHLAIEHEVEMIRIFMKFTQTPHKANIMSALDNLARIADEMKGEQDEQATDRARA